MPRNSVEEWSTTADDNTDVGGVNINNGCAPSGINDAIRAVMAQVKALYDSLSELAFSGSTSQLVPAGTVIAFAASSAPTGYLKCNGAAVSRSTYAALFAAIGTTYGAGNGSTTFNVPDLRGEFVRGLDDGRGVDSGRTLGSSQADAFEAHVHTVDPPSTDTSSDSHSHLFAAGDPGSFDYGTNFNDGTANPTAVSGRSERINTSSDSHNHTVNIPQFNSGSTGSSETRPRNVALLYCIKT